MAEERTPTPVNLVATQAFNGFATQVVKPTKETSMEDTTDEVLLMGSDEDSDDLGSDDVGFNLEGSDLD